MIKVDLDSTLKANKLTIKGDVKVCGKVNCIAHEIYAIINEFKEKCPEALEMALGMLVDELDEEEE